MIQHENIKYFNLKELTFDFYALRLQLVAKERIHFPVGNPANLLRGAFGAALKRTAGAETYARIFAPKSPRGPSGLADPPRPFVFRARHLDGVVISPGEAFHFDANVFDIRGDTLSYFTQVFSEFAKAKLQRVDGATEVQRVCLDRAPTAAHRVRVDFLTPTELKSKDQIVERPEFPILFGRIRDRLSTLSSLYGSGPLPIDFAASGERAARVRLTRCDIRAISAERRSGRTGQTHPMGGFVGTAEYEGELAEFRPYLETARWTGVGRQTVWGKGEIAVISSPPES
jgi:Uncharacterized conserved protein (DUF2276).